MYRKNRVGRCHELIKCHRIILFLATIVVVNSLFLDHTSWAQERNRNEEQRRERLANIEALLKKAEALQDEGKLEKAREIVKQAFDLRMRSQRPARQNKPKEQDNPEQVVERLDMGIRALQQLGRLELAEQLQEVRAQLTRELLRGKEGRRRAENELRQARAAAERERALAQRALAEAEQERARALVERERARAKKREAEAHARALQEELAQRERAMAAQQRERALKQELARRERARERHRSEDERAARGSKQEQNAKQLEIFRMARKAMLEADRPDAADMLEQMIHAAELRSEGRSAERVRVPKPGQQVELLAAASELWMEFGNEDRAHVIANLAEQMQEKLHSRDQRRREADRITDRELEIERKHLEIMEMAIPALKEKGREDTLEILERAIHAQRMNAQGRRDRESAEIREAAPELPVQIEILAYAADLWKEFGNENKAEALDALANHLRERMQDETHSRTARRERMTDSERKIDELEERIVELQRHIEHLAEELHKRDRDR